METKKAVDQLSNFLNRANYNTIAIHGDKQQFQRLAAIQKFSKGEVPILIATDVASRGLDFPYIPYVFNYDMPNNIDDYIHRIGRTGRCGNKGTAISFVNDNNKPIIKDLYYLLKKHKQEIPQWFEDLFRKYQYEKSDNYNKKNYFSNNKFSKNNFGSYNNGYEYGNTKSFNNGFRQRNNNYGGDEMRQSKYSNDRFTQNQSQNYDSFKKGSNYNSNFNDS